MFIPRIAYAVWLLTEIRDNHPNEVDISVMYDVACTLVWHLKGDLQGVCNAIWFATNYCRPMMLKVVLHQ